MYVNNTVNPQCQEPNPNASLSDALDDEELVMWSQSQQAAGQPSAAAAADAGPLPPSSWTCSTCTLVNSDSKLYAATLTKLFKGLFLVMLV